MVSLIFRSASAAIILPVAVHGFCSTAKAVPIEFSYGWETQFHIIAEVDPKSELGQEMQGESVSVAAKWDQLWFAVPIWTSGREYVLCKTHNGEDVREYLELQNQDANQLADLTLVPADRFSFPFYAYVPFGWIVVVAIALVVYLFSGSSPSKRFDRLMNDPRYQQALAILVAPHEATDEADETPPEELHAEGERRISEAIELLVSQGVSRQKATKNLEFIIACMQNPNNFQG